MGTKKKEVLPEKLNPKGCRLLAIAVIRGAVMEMRRKKTRSLRELESDMYFFKSDIFHFYAGLAYKAKTDYRSDEDIINDVMNGTLEEKIKHGCGAKSRWS